MARVEASHFASGLTVRHSSELPRAIRVFDLSLSTVVLSCIGRPEVHFSIQVLAVLGPMMLFTLLFPQQLKTSLTGAGRIDYRTIHEHHHQPSKCDIDGWCFAAESSTEASRKYLLT